MTKKWLFSAFLRDQMTTTEVSMARVYNWDVNRRKAENKPWGACAQAHHFRERRNTRKLEIRNCRSLIKKYSQKFQFRKISWTKQIYQSITILKLGFLSNKTTNNNDRLTTHENYCVTVATYSVQIPNFFQKIWVFFLVFLARTSLIFPTNPFRDYFYLFY